MSDFEVEIITGSEFEEILVNRIEVTDEIKEVIMNTLYGYDSKFMLYEGECKTILFSNQEIDLEYFDSFFNHKIDYEICVYLNNDYELFLDFWINGKNKCYKVDIGFGYDTLINLLCNILDTNK